MRRGMVDDSRDIPQGDELARFRSALAMLNAFAQVGARTFDVTFLDAEGQKAGYQSSRSRDDMRRALSAMLQRADRARHSVVIRPRSTTAHFIQLDDLTADAAAKVEPQAFIVLRTSPGNFQAWLALREEPTPEFLRRVRKACAADPSASGATRLAGTFNFKSRYAPAFPVVEMTQHNAGKFTSAAELENAGLVAPAEEPPQPRGIVSQPQRRGEYRGPRKWPDYARCIDHAPPAKQGRAADPDRSRADFVWCMTALDWGWSEADTAAKLLQVSAKARQKGQGYADLTAGNAAKAIAKRSPAPPVKSTPAPQL